MNTNLRQQVERPSSSAESENGKRRRIEVPAEQPDLDIIRNSVSPPEQEPQEDSWEFPIIQQLWHNQFIMDNTAGVSCGRITETEHATEGIRGEINIMKRRTYKIEEGQFRTNNKMYKKRNK